MARDNHFHLAVSNPCFELWILLHFRESPGARHRKEVVTLVREFLPSYGKYIEFAKLAPSIDQAVERAQRLETACIEEGLPALSNPSTGFYSLVQSMQQDAEHLLRT